MSLITFGKERLCFTYVCLSVCLSECSLDYSKCYKRILRFFGLVGRGSMNFSPILPQLFNP